LEEEYEKKFDKFRLDVHKEYQEKIKKEKASEKILTHKYKNLYDELLLNYKSDIKKVKEDESEKSKTRLESEKKHFEERLQLQEKKSKVDNELQLEIWKGEQLIIYNRKLAEEFKKYVKITEV
jgi:hypothetical protein